MMVAELKCAPLTGSRQRSHNPGKREHQPQGAEIERQLRPLSQSAYFVSDFSPMSGRAAVERASFKLVLCENARLKHRLFTVTLD